MRRWLLALTLLASCGATSDAPDGGVGAASLEVAILADGDPAGVDLDRASASFGEILLVSDSGEDLAGPVVVDLLDPETTVEVSGAEPGLYSRVRLKLGPEGGETLGVEGTFGSADLVLSAEDDEEIDLRFPVGERLDPGGRLRVEVEVDRGRWFSGVDLGSAEIEDDVLLLDPESGPNREMAERAIEGILGSFSVAGVSASDGGIGDDEGHRDGDDDGAAEDGGVDDGGED